MKCPHCNAIIEQENTAPKTYSKVPDAVKGICFTLSKSEKLEGDWGKFLKDMQGKQEWSEGQQKLFKLIHFKVTGSWPDMKTLAATSSAPGPEATSGPVDSLPF